MVQKITVVIDEAIPADSNTRKQHKKTPGARETGADVESKVQSGHSDNSSILVVE